MQRTSKQKPGPKPGFKMTKEHKDRISNALKGKAKSKTHVANIKKNHANVTGERNPMYGVTSPNKGHFGKDASAYIDGRTVNKNKWKKEVLERDKYTCQVCNKTKDETRIDTHHIKPQAKYPELALEVDNGISLCFECHPKYEKKPEVLRLVKLFNEKM